MADTIPYGRQNITDEDVSEVIEALQSDYLTQGPRVNIFEENFSKYVGAKYAVAVSNGTAALHLSALALNLEKGQKVITTPITFSATANCVRYCNAEVIFCDIDPKTYLIDIKKAREILENSDKGEVVGIIPVDFTGLPVDMESIKQLAEEFDLWVIEDACHAPGGFFKDSKGETQYCGNGVFADLTIFSFHPVKHIAAGEGGMITTNDASLYQRLLNLRTHGITRDPLIFTNPKRVALGMNLEEETEWPGWYMEMHDLGFNYRLTDFQAALGNSQLKRADSGIRRRQEIAGIYTSELSKVSGIIGMSGDVSGHAYHLFVIEAHNRFELYNHLRNNNILVQVHYIPTHLMPYYRKLGWNEGDLPMAENYYKNCLSLPMYPTLSETELDYVIEKIKNFYR